jgi:DNA-directed RNA polymerase I, II, and III subunit RPABC2
MDEDLETEPFEQGQIDTEMDPDADPKINLDMNIDETNVESVPEDEPEEDEEEEQEEKEDILDTEQNIPLVTQPFMNSDDEEDEGEDEDEEDENYLQKFDEVSQQKIISDFHPELHSHNYHEIDILSRVVRDETGQIIDPLHRTLPFITRYEKARILGERAKQINGGGKPLVEVESTVLDGYLIALKEFEEKKIPFILKRPLPNGGCEYWKFSDLEILA